MKRQLCFNSHHKIYRCLAVPVGCLRQCPEPSLYYNIKNDFFCCFPIGYSLFQPIILILLPLVIRNLCHSCMMLCPNLVLYGCTCPYMSSAAFFFFLLRPTPAKQHYSSQWSEVTCYLQFSVNRGISKWQNSKSDLNIYRDFSALIDTLLLLTSACDEWISHQFSATTVGTIREPLWKRK